jgi:hypothetical protein
MSEGQKNYQTTDDVQRRTWAEPTGQRASHRGEWPIAIAVALGWVCLIWAAICLCSQRSR